MRAFNVSILFFLLACAGTAAQSAERLFIHPWVELEPVERIAQDQYPIPLKAAGEKLLEEGRILFSGMIYGWTFNYIPGDLSRRVQESFVLTPVAAVRWGSARLDVRETEVAEAKLWARMSYTLSEDESQWRRAWESNTVTLSTGQGKASVMGGSAAKMTSLRNAIRDAIRRGLDTRYINKPREISGDVLLWDDPITFVRAGDYSTTVKVRFRLRDLVPYRIF